MSTNLGIRQVVDKRTIPLDWIISGTARKRLPFLETEPRCQYLHDCWIEQLCPKFIQLHRRLKNSRWMNPKLSRMVFQTGMENACLEFSRRTENVQVEFRQESDHTTSRARRKRNTVLNHKYVLLVTKLKPVQEELRNAPACVAEIPSAAAEGKIAHAVPVTLSSFQDSNTATTSAEIIETTALDHVDEPVETIYDDAADGAPTSAVPMANANFVEDYEPDSTKSGTNSPGLYQCRNDPAWIPTADASFILIDS